MNIYRYTHTGIHKHTQAHTDTDTGTHIAIPPLGGTQSFTNLQEETGRHLRQDFPISRGQFLMENSLVICVEAELNFKP